MSCQVKVTLGLKLHVRFPVAERKQTISVLGQNVVVTEIPIVKSDEKTNEYELEDGSVIRFRAVATAILRVEGQHDGDGNPIYLVKNGTIVNVVSAPETVRRPGGPVH